MKSATGCKTQQELAEYFNISQSAISAAQRKQITPATWLIAMLRKDGINPEWVLTGKGTKRLIPDPSDTGAFESALTVVMEKKPLLLRHLRSSDLASEIYRRSLDDEDKTQRGSS